VQARYSIDTGEKIKYSDEREARPAGFPDGGVAKEVFAKGVVRYCGGK
jgi:hypothetical protein